MWPVCKLCKKIATQKICGLSYNIIIKKVQKDLAFLLNMTLHFPLNKRYTKKNVWRGTSWNESLLFHFHYL